VLATLSPPGAPLKLGAPRRLRIRDALSYPTLDLGYDASVFAVHASAAVKRVLGLAYVLVWAVSEIRQAAPLAGLAPLEQVTLLVDEVEAHLHPKWQRAILPALLTVVEHLAPQAAVQTIVTTHAPLVLASVETRFDPAQDILLELEQQAGDKTVRVVEEPLTPLGDANTWLMQRFGLKQPRSTEAEAAIERAARAVESPERGAARGVTMRVSSHLEVAFALAQEDATRWRHELVTVEHLLHAMLRDDEAARIVRHAGGDPTALEKKLERFLDESATLAEDAAVQHPALSPEFNRAVQRAATYVESAGKSELRLGDILVAIFAERDSPAARMLAEENVTRFDVVSYLVYGVSTVDLPEGEDVPERTFRVSPELEVAFSLAQREAARRRHEAVTVEHLLYALLFDDEARDVIRHAGGDPTALRKRLEDFLDDDVIPLHGDADAPFPELSLGFNRAVQRAAVHAQSTGKKALRGGDVLCAILTERDSPAVTLLGLALPPLPE
jgi:hypothetical protein